MRELYAGGNGPRDGGRGEGEMGRDGRWGGEGQMGRDVAGRKKGRTGRNRV